MTFSFKEFAAPKEEQKIPKQKKTSKAPMVKAGRKAAITDAQIYLTLDMIKEDETMTKILGVAKISTGTYYRIKNGSLKPSAARGKVSPTPEKVGKREIDKKPRMLTAKQFEEVKESFGDGMALEPIALVLEVDLDQVRAAIKADNYTQYTAGY